MISVDLLDITGWTWLIQIRLINDLDNSKFWFLNKNFPIDTIVKYTDIMNMDYSREWIIQSRDRVVKGA